MAWYQFTLISALSLALADTVLKKYLTELGVWDLLMVRFAAPGLLLLPYALQYPLPELNSSFTGLMAICIVLEIAAMLLYVYAITTNPLHLTLPYLGFTPVFNILTAYLFLGERIDLHGAIGIAVVVVGSYILNIPQGFTLKRVAEPLLAIWQCRGSRLMLLCAVIYSFTGTISKKAMGYASPESFGAYYFVIVGGAVLILYPLLTHFSHRANPRQLLKNYRAVAIAALLMAIMVVTHFLAIAQIQVAYMVAVKRSSMLFGILFGALFFHEKNIARNLVAGSVMLAGIFLLGRV